MNNQQCDDVCVVLKRTTVPDASHNMQDAAVPEPA
jgi:hypothetical protein